MRCLTDPQIEALVLRPDDPTLEGLCRHVGSCDACRARLEEARSDAGLIAEIRELSELREAVRPLVEKMPPSAG